MIDVQTAATVSRHVREALLGKGDLGRFLVSEVDRILSEGVEQIEEEVTVTKGGRTRRSGKEVIARRQATEQETLQAYVTVLEEFLIGIYQVAGSVSEGLSRYSPIGDVVITFKSDFEDFDSPDEESDIHLREVRLVEDVEATERALRHLEALLRQD